MYINNLAAQTGDDAFYEQGFHHLIESHFTYLLSLPNTAAITIEPSLAYRHIGDLFGALDELGIPKQYHHTIMRLNGYYCTGDFQQETQTLVIPDLAEIDLLKSIYRSTTITV